MTATNNATFIGYVAQEPKTWENQEGKTSVARFSISVEERLYDKEVGKRTPQKMWFDVVAFGGLASVVQSIVKAGRTVAVAGRIDLGTYEKDGVTFKSVQLQAEDLSIVNWGNKDSQETKDENPTPVTDVDEEEFPF